MTQQTEIETSWWSNTGWFAQAGGIQEALLQPKVLEPAPQAGGTAADEAGKPAEVGQGVGGAVAQCRFMGRCHIPIATTTPVDGAPVVSYTAQAAAKQQQQQLIPAGSSVPSWKREQQLHEQHHRVPPSWSGAAHTCDGQQGQGQAQGSGSSWVFDVDTWQWQHKGGSGAAPRSARHDIAARRWVDGRETSGAALASQEGAGTGAPEGTAQQGASKRQRVVVTAVRGESGQAGWSSIGGLAKQKELLTKAVLYPLRHPALFKRLGVDAVRGVLLHGPPGCGKTALARALAGEAPDVYFEALSGAECGGGDEGISRMRRAFYAAKKNAPAILFIDELDALAPSREGGAALSQNERQATSQLLTMIDELRRSRAQVSLVAATNRRAAVDSALRRAGRLDLEVSLGALAQQDRLEVLRCATCSMPLGAGVDLPSLAQRLRGYTAADCSAVCTEAALRCAAEAVAAAEGGELGEGGWEPQEGFLEGLRVEGRHFEAAVGVLGPAVLRGLCPEMPEVKWEDVGGLQEAKAAVRDLVEFPLAHGDLMLKMGLPPPRGALLYGPPGCGKTLLAKAAATGCGANFMSVRGPELLQMWLGESERAVRTLFETARCAAPCLIFFDELDSIAGRRGGSSEAAGASASARVLNQLLIEMDGMSDRGGVFVLAATNRPDVLDPAILRPGRFDHLVKVSLPDEPSRLEILGSRLRQTPLHPDVDLPALAAATEGMSGADLAELCRRAGMDAIRAWVAAEQAAGAGTAGAAAGNTEAMAVKQAGEAGVVLTQAQLLRVLGKMRRSVGAEAAGQYNVMEAQLREGSLAAPGSRQEGKEEGEEGDMADAGSDEGEGSGSGTAQRAQQRGREQGQLMQHLMRATLDHSYAIKAQELQSRVEQLEGLLRAAGLEVPGAP